MGLFCRMERATRLLYLLLSRETTLDPWKARDLIHNLGRDWTGLCVQDLLPFDLPPAVASRLCAPGMAEEADRLSDQCEELGIGLIGWEDESYPQLLRECEDAPLVLFWRGAFPILKERNLAIVGTRRPTGYGLRHTAQIVRELAPLSPLVISGMAFGIDISAHLAALDQGLCTWGVLAQGLDRIYPGAHQKQAIRILESGGTLLSEFPPGTPSRAYHFPRRNRIITGLCDALLVVESAGKGGSLISAELALSYNREVFALPGPVDRDQSAGCLELIRNCRAALIRDARDLAESMNWLPASWSGNRSTESWIERIERALPDHLQDMKSLLLFLTEADSRTQEELLRQTGWSARHLAVRLLEAELAGWLRLLPGNRVEARWPAQEMTQPNFPQ